MATQLSLQLILIIGIGLFAQRTGIVKGDFDQQLSSFILNLALPCMIIKSMRGTFSLEELKKCGWLLLLGLVVLGVELLLGQLCYLRRGKSASGRILRFGMAYTNFTFVGMPVMETLYGQQGLFYFVVFLVPIRMVYYSSVKPMLSPPSLAQERESMAARFKGWFSPPVTAVFVGLLLYITGLALPAFLSGVINSLGSIASPLGMVLCGISLGKYEFRRLLRARYLILPIIRTLLLPGLFLVLCRLFGIPKEMTQVVVIFAALPVASLLSAFTLQYEPDREVQFESAGSVLLSTMLCAVTIPVWAYVLNL